MTLQVSLPCSVGDELWYVSDLFKEVWPCIVKAIRMDITTEQPNPAFTLVVARKAPSQLNIHLDVSDFGRELFFKRDLAYEALERIKRAEDNQQHCAECRSFTNWDATVGKCTVTGCEVASTDATCSKFLPDGM